MESARSSNFAVEEQVSWEVIKGGLVQAARELRLQLLQEEHCRGVCVPVLIVFHLINIKLGFILGVGY